MQHLVTRHLSRAYIQPITRCKSKWTSIGLSLQLRYIDLQIINEILRSYSCMTCNKLCLTACSYDVVCLRRICARFLVWRLRNSVQVRVDIVVYIMLIHRTLMKYCRVNAEIKQCFMEHTTHKPFYALAISENGLPRAGRTTSPPTRPSSRAVAKSVRRQQQGATHHAPHRRRGRFSVFSVSSEYWDSLSCG